MTAMRLLPLLRDIERAASLTPAEWDDTVRLARQARLLGLVAHRLREREDLWGRVFPPVRGHLRSAINYSAHRAQMLRMELDALNHALPPRAPVVILKGAAYLMQGLEFARGRMPNDVDLMVSRANLDEAESALKAAGWEAETEDAYDQRYYREWSHELPPMRYPGHPLEVDLHHTISPVTSRIRADDELLFGALRTLATSRFVVLHPADQIVHAAIHLFQDSELSGHLRDLVDIDGLVRASLRDEADWLELLRRARGHGAEGVLAQALHYCRAWLGTPVPTALDLERPPAWRARLFDWMFRTTMLPGLPGGRTGLSRTLATRMGRLRYHWLRMPPGLLARHVLAKGWRRAWSRSAAAHARVG